MEITLIHRPSSSEVLAVKNPRVARACRQCRQRKIRCDGVSPVCRSCSLRDGSKCTYDSPRRRRNATVNGGRRISVSPANSTDAESDKSPPLSNLSLQISPLDSVSLLAGVSSSSEFLASRPPASMIERPRPNLLNVLREFDEAADQVEDDDSNPNAMGAHISGNSSAPSSAFFGRSSAYMFMEELKDVVADIGRFPRKRKGPQSVSSPVIQLNTYDVILPSRNLADHLVDMYITFIHSLYPFLHIPSFRNTYEQVWNGSHPLEKDPMFYAILNLVFALGAQFSDNIPTHNREETLHSYFERASRIIDLNNLNMKSDLQLIQALLLSCQVLQGTKRTNECWNLMGLTIRIAQSHGLQVDMDINQCGSYIELECRRRLWWGCVLLDKLLSMTLGRASMISNNCTVVPPSMIDDNYIHASTIEKQPANQPSLMTFFVVSTQFFIVVGSIIRQLYSESETHSWARDVKFTLNYMQELSEWHERVPWFLRAFTDIEGENEVDDRIKRQARILLARYLHGRIMLLRVCLLHLLRHQFRLDKDSNLYMPLTRQPRSMRDFWNNEDSFLISYSGLCAKLCMESAMALTELTCINAQSNSRGPVWWYNLFYIYTSATVLLTARLIPMVWNDFDEVEVEKAWGYITTTIHSLESKTSSATKYLDFLKKMKAQVYTVAASRSELCQQITMSLTPQSDLNVTENVNRAQPSATSATNAENNDNVPAIDGFESFDLGWFNAMSYTGFPFFEE
ncbi:fungal-specific transcription factor domain-containing protein [Lipomyces starkeyi]